MEHQEKFILASALKQASVPSIALTKPQKMGNENSDSSSDISSLSSTMSSSSNVTQLCEKDGMVYIAGFLA